MANDELLRLSGSTNNPLETITATGNGTGVLVGANRLVLAKLRIGGAVSGTTPTLDIKTQESTTAAGTYTDIPGGAFAQQTASMAASAASPAGGGPAIIAVRTTKDYVRIVKTVGGTTPSFASVSVVLDPPVGGVTAG